MKKILMTLAAALIVIPAMLAAKPGFTMWQLASQEDNIGNSYVFLTDKGKVVVLDGGFRTQDNYLRGVIQALGNEVEAWFISHPHNDHCGALTQILEDQKAGGMKINNVYHSRFSESLMDCETPYNQYAREFYTALDKAEKEGRLKVHDLHEADLDTLIKIDGMNIKILGVTNEELRTNPFNNSSMVMRVWDKKKSILFLGDAGIECGDKLYNRMAKEGTLDLLNCDYIQMAHHGQQGCSKEFYNSIKFNACLWPTPTWVWTNNFGAGPGSGNLKTAETRQWMDEIGIKEHHVTCLEGSWRLD